MNEPQPAIAGRILAAIGLGEAPGLLMGFLIPLGLAVLSFWTATLGAGSSRYPPLGPIIFTLSIGLSQAVYVLPFQLLARQRRWRQFGRGLWAGAGAVLVTNIALWMDALMHDR